MIYNMDLQKISQSTFIHINKNQKNNNNQVIDNTNNDITNDDITNDDKVNKNNNFHNYKNYFIVVFSILVGISLIIIVLKKKVFHNQLIGLYYE